MSRTLRPLLVTRVANGFPGAVVGLLIAGLLASTEHLVPLSVLAIAAGAVLTVRGVRMRVVLGATQLRIHGYFRSRTIDARAIADIDESTVFWWNARGKIRWSIVTAFLDLGSAGERFKRHNVASMREIDAWLKTAKRNAKPAPSVVTARGRQLDDLWTRAWPGAGLFDVTLPADRRVSFAALAEKGSRLDRAARAEATRRHTAVLEWLRASVEQRELVVLFEEYGAGDAHHGWHSHVLPQAVPLRRGIVIDRNEPFYTIEHWIDESAHDLAPLIEALVHDKAGRVIIANSGLSWRYHPDVSGGVAFAADSRSADALRAAFADWR